MAWQSNDKDLINAALQAAVNKNQAGIRQAQSGNRFQNLLSIAAMAANQNANPNSEMGRIMGGASNTYLNNLVSRNQGDFRSAVTAIHQDPNLGPQDKMTALMGTLSYYGQDPKDYSDILDAYGKQIQYQNQNAPVPLLNPQGQPVVDPNTGQPTMVPKGAKIQPSGSGSNRTYFQQATKLRTEFDNLSKDFRKVRDSYGRVKVAAQDPSPAGDLALIFNYMKILDPASVVRESEFATAENAGAVPDKVRNLYNKVMKGQRLAPEQRADFVNRAGRLYGSQESIQKRSVERFSNIAKRYNIDPSDVIDDLVNMNPQNSENAETSGDLNSMKSKYGLK